MKRIKITLKSGCKSKKFWLFPDAESLYVWLTSIEDNEPAQVEGIEQIVLEPDCFIEAELRGFEYAYEGNQKFKRLELIRLGRAQQPKNASGLLVTIHSGWVFGGLLPMKNFSDADIVVKTIDANESKIDLAALFNDGAEEPEEK